jgi:hypothetical protein
MKIAKIEISDTKLMFFINENDWCQTELHAGKEKFKLGAEDWSVLKVKILTAFTNLSNSTEPEWMLSLSEEHCSLYRQNIDGKNLFFFQNSKGNQIWESNFIDSLNEESLQIY